MKEKDSWNMINLDAYVKELTGLLCRIFSRPEVYKVEIKGISISSSNEADKIWESVCKCYHDILSDIDMKVYVSLHPEDIGNGYVYHRNPDRIGLTRNNYLGLAFAGERLSQTLRVIMRNGTRFDIIFHIREDITVPVYHIPQEEEKEIKDTKDFWPRWDLRKADTFWFNQILALAKLMRGDYLIADHVANMQINETLVAQMIDRDNRMGTNIHRYGNKEDLEYEKDFKTDSAYQKKDKTYNRIADKIIAAGMTYDRLIKKLNSGYDDRNSIFFEIWKQYEHGILF